MTKDGQILKHSITYRKCSCWEVWIITFMSEGHLNKMVFQHTDNLAYIYSVCCVCRPSEVMLNAWTCWGLCVINAQWGSHYSWINQLCPMSRSFRCYTRILYIKSGIPAEHAFSLQGQNLFYSLYFLICLDCNGLWQGYSCRSGHISWSVWYVNHMIICKWMY